MDARRRLLPVFEVGEDDHCDDCGMDGAAGAASATVEDVGMAGGVQSPRLHPTAGAISRGREGMEISKVKQSARNNCSDAECEEDIFFDLGTGDDSSSEAGGGSSSENIYNSPSPSSPSKGNHSGCDQLNDGKETSGVGYVEQKFRRMADSGDRHKNLDEFWEIVNKTFASEQEAFMFYNNYAWGKGFSVRKEKVRRSKPSGTILFRRFVCGKEGEREGKWLDKEDYSRRPRALTRCDCAASLDIRLDRSHGVWYVDNFVDEHNHRLATPDEVPFLWSHRKIKDFHKNEIMSMEATGIRKHVIRDVLQCRYGGYDKVGIVTKDIYNFCSKNKRSRIIDGDARTVLNLMLKRQKSHPDFHFKYRVDDHGRLMSMFLCDTQSRMDYQSFGDVVVFDSTYRMNRYKMPFVLFVGLNHHRNTTVFGCGTMCDERADSYVWVLEAFLRAMCQKRPHSVITDGDNSMIKAIRQVLSGVSHRICSWHMEKNIMKHLHSDCLNGFRTLMYYASSETFEARWNAFPAENQTASNREWLVMMYKNRKLWAAAFQYDKFFLGMKSNQRSESLNSTLHRHLDIYMSLLDLVEHYDNCVLRLRETEADFDCRASQSKPVPLTKHNEIEVACSRIFTAANFYMQLWNGIWSSGMEEG